MIANKPHEPARLKRLLVLAGTQEARHLVAELANDNRFAIIASLAGATPSPLPLAAEVHRGGFGGTDGLAAFCRDQSIDAIVDMTHPFARQISANATKAAMALDLPCIVHDRAPWQPRPGDQWREFDSWQDMVAAIPSGERVFLAGGSASIAAFLTRDDIFLWARALNVDVAQSTEKVTFLNAMPDADPATELALFRKKNIGLLCCKNAGGDASVAKIEAARMLGIPIWLLARTRPQNNEYNVPNVEIYDSVEAVLEAVTGLIQT